MYSDYFGLSQLPFENNLDPKFLYLSEAHEEVLAGLLYFVRERKSFALVSGDVGTGKTMLISCLMSMLPDNVRPVLINHPDVGFLEIIYHLGVQLGIAKENKTVLQLLAEMKVVLAEELAADRRTLLIIDEAHLLSDRSLEHIRLLSNIETQSDKLLQILLVGQHELSHRLNQMDMRQLRQRININRFLSALDTDEAIRYIDHRLQQVGSSFDTCFDKECGKYLLRWTHGIPRLINQLCDNALLICSMEKSGKVSPVILQKAIEALETDILCVPDDSVQPLSWWTRRWVRLLLGFSLGLLLVAILVTLGLEHLAGW